MFTVAGFSTLNGITKVRYANDLARVKVLAKGGHTGITLINLPMPMEKGEVVKFLMTQEEFTSNPLFAQTLADANEKYNVVKVKRTPATAGNRDKPKREAKKPKKAPKVTDEVTETTVTEATPEVVTAEVVAAAE